MGVDTFVVSAPEADLEAASRDPELQGELAFVENGVDTGRGLNALHFLLNWTTDRLPTPLGKAFFVEEMDEDSTFAYLTAAEVLEIVPALGAVTDDFLRRRVAEALDQRIPMYPSNIWDDPEFFVQIFRTLRGYYARAAAAGLGIGITQF